MSATIDISEMRIGDTTQLTLVTMDGQMECEATRTGADEITIKPVRFLSDADLTAAAMKHAFEIIDSEQEKMK
ncbi:MAG: hypothetical protein WC091_02575 [Sulfuricellaceae bacterium]